MMYQFTDLDVVIANGESLSAAVRLGGSALVGLAMPAAWTAAGLTFQVSYDGVTYNNLYDKDGNEVALTVAASRFLWVNPTEWLSIAYLKIRSGTSGTPVAQEAERTIKLVVSEI